jgi:simple sugar transport system permease protein
MDVSASEAESFPARTVAAEESVRVRVAFYLTSHREFLSSLVFFLLMIAIFAAISPGIWFTSGIYTAVAVSLPTLMIVAVAVVFVVASGEIDLSFASIVTLTGMVFAYASTGGIDPYAAAVLAILAGTGVGLLNGILVAYVGLSSLVATLGMSYLWAGLVNIISNGTGKPLYDVQGASLATVLVGEVGSIPVQLFWGVGFGIVAIVLFTRHKLGAYARFAGDNINAAREMGVNVGLTKLASFGLVGLASGLVGVMISLINVNFYPNAGEGLLLPVLAAVFVGGTPMFGGVGTVAGALVGSMTISFINVGIVTSGFAGFYTDFLYGVVIVLSLVVHRLTGMQRRTLRRSWIGLFAAVRAPRADPESEI